MEIPKEVKDHLDFLNTYQWNNKLITFNILHIYSSGELCYPNGYYDSMWMKVILFNSDTKERREIKRKCDGINFFSDIKCTPSMIRIFADGSFFIRFLEFHTMDIHQCLQIMS